MSTVSNTKESGSATDMNATHDKLLNIYQQIRCILRTCFEKSSTKDKIHVDDSAFKALRQWFNSVDMSHSEEFRHDYMVIRNALIPTTHQKSRKGTNDYEMQHKLSEVYQTLFSITGRYHTCFCIDSATVNKTLQMQKYNLQVFYDKDNERYSLQRYVTGNVGDVRVARNSYPTPPTEYLKPGSDDGFRHSAKPASRKTVTYATTTAVAAISQSNRYDGLQARQDDECSEDSTELQGGENTLAALVASTDVTPAPLPVNVAGSWNEEFPELTPTAPTTETVAEVVAEVATEEPPQTSSTTGATKKKSTRAVKKVVK